MSLGRRIQDLRKAKNITQRELAEKIGKGVSTVQKYEIDVITPPIDVISRIAEALETEINELLNVKKEFEYITLELTQAQNYVKSLNEIEQRNEMLDKYDNMNVSGQTKVCEYVNDIYDKFKKDEE